MRNRIDEPTRLQLLFVGDVMLGRLVNQALKNVQPAYPWGDTLPFFERADSCFCNLECALTDQGTPWTATPKVFHFRSDAKNADVLKTAHITAVSLANNHTLDFGYDGLLETLDNLASAGIHYAGAGRNAFEAASPVRWEAKGQKLGFIALTDNQPEWEATVEQAGIHYVPITLQDERARQLLAEISKIRQDVDYLIVSAHWGPNWGSAPPAEHVAFAHALIEAGADIIFGHSGHIVRGVELYKRRPILYCAGDFIDDYAIDPIERNDLSFLFLVEIEERVIMRLQLYPTVIKDFQARRAEGRERAMIVSTMQRLCGQLNTPVTWNEQVGRLEVRIS